MVAIKLHVDVSPHECKAASFLYHLLYYSDNPHDLTNEMLKGCLEIDEVREIGEFNIFRNGDPSQCTVHTCRGLPEVS